MTLALNLRLHVTTPSNHLWSTFLLWAPPQFLNQAPSGAQQLLLLDFSNVPHLGHVIVLVIVDVTAGVLTDVVIDVLTISSRSDNGRRDTYWCVGSVVTDVGAGVHTICDIDPDVPSNMRVFGALEWTQKAPQSFCLKDVAWENIRSILSTLDTSHFEISPLNNSAW